MVELPKPPRALSARSIVDKHPNPRQEQVQSVRGGPWQRKTYEWDSGDLLWFWSHRSRLVYGPWRPLDNLDDRGVPRTSPCMGNGGHMHRKKPRIPENPFGGVGEGEAWGWKEFGQGLDKGLPERIANATALLRSGLSGQLWEGQSRQDGWGRVSKVWARETVQQ